MAMGGVPEPYLDAWARLQYQKPMRVSDAEWRQAINDAGRFLDQWGSRAVEFGWAAWRGSFDTFRAMAGRGDSFGSSKASESKLSARNMRGPMAGESSIGSR